jgi:hypothetical protein
MSDPTAVNELKELQRGRGCQAEDMHLRVGPVLRRAFGVAESDPASVVRSKVIGGVSSYAARLPPDMHLAVRTALALDAETAGRFLKDRTEWLAQQFGRDPKTARRRVTDGFSRLGGLIDELAERITDSSYAPDGWYVASLSSVLRMDLDPPVLTETRRIVATTDDLDEIVLSVSIPRDPGRSHVRVQVEYGGEIVEEHDNKLSHVRFVMRLPRPLALGQEHDYSVSFHTDGLEPMRPYYVFTPLRRCDHFAMRVRFGPGPRPGRLWRVTGLPPRVVDDFQPTDEPVELDSLGEVRTEFFGLRSGLSYGIQWSPG